MGIDEDKLYKISKKEYLDKHPELRPEKQEFQDKIYEHYKNGEDIYLQCFCKPLPCHCDIIADRLQRKLIKEKLEERKKLKNSKS